MVVRARQSFQLFRQNTRFLENNRVSCNFLYEILHCLITITKQYKNQSIKSNFKLTTQVFLVYQNNK